MILVFICLDWIPPLHPNTVVQRDSSGPLLPLADRLQCIEKLGATLSQFQGVAGVLATKRMMGRRIAEVQSSLGQLGSIVIDSVNTLADEPYEFVSDYMRTRAGEWVALASSRESFPKEHQGRVRVGWNGDEIDEACANLSKLLRSFATAAITPPTSAERFRLWPNRHMAAALKSLRTASTER